MTKAPCTHLATVKDMPPPPRACPACVAAGDTWVNLRQCMMCGQVGCCDSSKNKHATQHYEAAGHPVMRSLEEGETWLWCFEDEAMLEAPTS